MDVKEALEQEEKMKKISETTRIHLIQLLKYRGIKHCGACKEALEELENEYMIVEIDCQCSDCKKGRAAEKECCTEY